MDVDGGIGWLLTAAQTTAPLECERTDDGGDREGFVEWWDKAVWKGSLVSRGREGGGSCWSTFGILTLQAPYFLNSTSRSFSRVLFDRFPTNRRIDDSSSCVLLLAQQAVYLILLILTLTL